MNTIRVDRNFINDTYFSQLDYPICLSSRVLTLVLRTPKSNLMRMSLMYNSCANLIVKSWGDLRAAWRFYVDVNNSSSISCR